jgi:type III pantothenate kinase
MSQLCVADVGNSRIKWGRCKEHQVAEMASLPHDAPQQWQTQLEQWSVTPGRWVVAGVNPERMARLVDWLNARAMHVATITSYQQLPISLSVQAPERVGLDRLLNAVAAQSRERGGRPAVLVDAGSAVTVDYLDEANVFGGGAIFPGLRLMAQALHSYTAKLPFVEVKAPLPPMPATVTETAIAAGVYGAVVGGIEHLLVQLAARSPQPPQVYLTGGDHAVLAPGLSVPVEVWPTMTLEGIRLTALSLP